MRKINRTQDVTDRKGEALQLRGWSGKNSLKQPTSEHNKEGIGQARTGQRRNALSVEKHSEATKLTKGRRNL